MNNDYTLFKRSCLLFVFNVLFPRPRRVYSRAEILGPMLVYIKTIKGTLHEKQRKALNDYTLTISMKYGAINIIRPAFLQFNFTLFLKIMYTSHGWAGYVPLAAMLSLLFRNTVLIKRANWIIRMEYVIT